MSTDHQGLRERVAATLASHDLPDGTDRDGQWAADALMPLITAELNERDTRIAELEKRLLGTLARRCSIPGCDASYDAVDGPPPEEQPPNPHWMLSPSPSLTLCPDHAHLWPTHRPRLDHTTRLASCECGHPLPGPTLGHMATAWIAHALTVLEGESGPLGVYWDKLVERDGQGGVYAFCTAWTGRPVYLAMKEEDAEALAGSLLNTPDGEEATPRDEYDPRT